MNNRSPGIDFSKYAGGYAPEGETNIDFSVVKAIEGTWPDPKFDTHTKSLQDEGVFRQFIYDYYRDSVPWKQQVDLTLELAQGSPIDFYGIWVDFEGQNNNLSRTYPRCAREVAEMVRYYQMEYPNSGIYCNMDAYITYLEPELGSEWLNKIPLWIAAPFYIDKKSPREKVLAGEFNPQWFIWRMTPAGVWYKVYPKRDPYNWTLWQYSFLGDPKLYGIIDKLAVDEDCFNGNVDALNRWMGFDVPEEPPSLEEIVKKIKDGRFIEERRLR